MTIPILMIINVNPLPFKSLPFDLRKLGDVMFRLIGKIDAL